MNVDTDLRIGHRFAALEDELTRLKAINEERSKRLSLLVFSGSFDRLLAAFTIALGASAMGIEVTMFFSFWGITALRTHRRFLGKSLCETMISALLPAHARQVNPSRWCFAGLGRVMFRYLMRRHKLMQLEEMISSARKMGVHFVSCETSTMLMGIRAEELLSGVQPGGVATFLDAAFDSQVALVM